MLSAEPAAIPLAGGTDIMVNWPQRLSAHAATYLDLSGVGDLRSIRWTDDALVLGAMTTYWDVIEDAQIAAAFPRRATSSMPPRRPTAYRSSWRTMR